jgi:triacylglycerol lipase
MIPPTAIVLIPGFFGYGSFGGDAYRPILEYFGGVRDQLERAGVNEPTYFIVAHEPPPTGSLEARVASLDELAGKLLRGDALPHDARMKTGQRFVAQRIHLVGHSTGGVDARLFANTRYRWPGAPTSAKDRQERVDKIGTIVTLSAPFFGTPIATHIQVDENVLLQAIHVLTMLGVFQDGKLDAFAVEILKAGFRGLPEVATRGLLGALWSKLAPELARRVDPGVRRSPPVLLERAPHVSGDIAEQVGAFFQSIDDDHQLLGNLTPENLAKVNAEVEGGDSRPIDSYVTVAPAPRYLDNLEDRLIARLVYGILYDATAHDPVRRDIPSGKRFGDRRKLAEVLASPVACDGVVPARSQSLERDVAGVILGDHLDVVGSFPGGQGANVMHSRAGFDKARFRDLWDAVARTLLA